MSAIAGFYGAKSAVQLPRFQTKAGEDTIDFQRIVYLSAQVNYTIFHLVEGEYVLTSLSLSTYSALLENYGFMRIHKSYLLNLHYLHQCRIHHFASLTLPSGQTLAISRRKRATLRKMVKVHKM